MASEERRGDAFARTMLDEFREIAAEEARKAVRELIGKPANSQNAKEFLTVEELAAHPKIGVSKRTIGYWRKSGLPAHWAGRELRFRLSEVLAWREQQKRAG